MWSDPYLAWADRWWDEERGLLWNPPGSFDDYGLEGQTVHMVPQTAWYAVGCLMRGDRDRALRITEELRALQYDEPGSVIDGTFARFAETPKPGPDAVEWIDYDPNWRQFIGTTFSLMQLHFDLELREPIERAISGEPRDRVSPRYSNIALMKAWLERDEELAREVARLFEEHGAFGEYNSPTYYGIDLYALALWRKHPPTERFKTWGDAMRDDLWRDIARWYHPGLRNLCGPYSRAYGMDMSSYVALFGLWLPDQVVPDITQPFEHSHDLTMAPVIELLDDRPATLATETGLVSQRIDEDRVAMGWLGDDVMLGGESGGKYRAIGQYHPATAHWRGGWARIRSPYSVNATVHVAGELVVEGQDLTIESEGEFPGEIERTDDAVVLRVSRSR